jgi:hypothetical protein
MDGSLSKLLSIASSPLCESVRSLKLENQWQLSSVIVTELESVLKCKNGFYAFESALHVFPSGCGDSTTTLEKWNEPGLWKNSFRSELDSIVFFAEDLFGMQFGIMDEFVIKFDPETSEIDETFAESLGGWASIILDGFDYQTGYPLAHEWQRLNGPILPGRRLLPKIPFVLGGEFELSNLYEVDAIQGMRFRADLSKQIKDLPDGTPVQIDVVD